jgi:hypothetical protein
MTAVLIGLQGADFMAFSSQDKQLLDLGTDENLAEVRNRRNFDCIASSTAIFYGCGSFETMVTRDSALCFGAFCTNFLYERLPAATTAFVAPGSRSHKTAKARDRASDYGHFKRAAPKIA